MHHHQSIKKERTICQSLLCLDLVSFSFVSLVNRHNRTSLFTNQEKWLCMQDGYAWIFLEPNIQTSLLKVTHIHHYRKRHMQERRTYSHICLCSCLCARQVVPVACVSSPW